MLLQRGQKGSGALPEKSRRVDEELLSCNLSHFLMPIFKVNIKDIPIYTDICTQNLLACLLTRLIEQLYLLN